MSLLPSPCHVYVSVRCFRSLHCIPLKFLECFLKCHEEFSSASILQSFRDTSSSWGSWVQVFYFSFFSPLWYRCLVLTWRTSKPSMPPCQYSARQCRWSKGGPIVSPTIATSGIQGAWRSQTTHIVSAVCSVTDSQVASCRE